MFKYCGEFSENMTTIVGIKTSADMEAIVLASDQCMMREYIITMAGGAETKGSFREDHQKIFTSVYGDFAFAISGTYDSKYNEFVDWLTKENVSIEKRLRRRMFAAFRDLNCERWDWRQADEKNKNGMLIASRFNNKPELFHCFPLGRVELVHDDYRAIGSGSIYAAQFLKDKKPSRPISLDEGVKLAVDCIGTAHRDVYTLGLDIVIVGTQRIMPFGDMVTRLVQNTNDEIKRQVSEEAYKALR